MKETTNRGLREIDRRRFLTGLTVLGLTGAAAPKLLSGAEEKGEITVAMLREAERLTGLEFSEPERELMLEGVNDLLGDYRSLRGVDLPNTVPPAIQFDPRPYGFEFPPAGKSHPSPSDNLPLPKTAVELAFLPVTHLAELIRRRAITSTELTRLYLERLKKHGPVLECVVTLTEERALKQAAKADREIAAGQYRGPLHGIPWGAKDLLSVDGYPTTWGAMPFKDQSLDTDAAVVRRLDEAGAVLVAKLTLGALAWGDVWFGGKTRNPWNVEQGSSGSSAGSASATAAGLVGFAIGSETWGSIVSPATRCGVTGLRPTFGRVSRHGAMALSWTMDKLGPICRSVEDTALVLEAIAGPDDLDPTVVDQPFAWDASLDPRTIRLGYTKALFEEEPEEDSAEWHDHDLATLDRLRSLGFELVPIELPEDLPIGSLAFILSAEAAAAFDELTRSGDDELLVRQIENAWPNVFRQARAIPAVEYIQANRVRTKLKDRWAEIFEQVDAYVAPSFGGDNLLATNLTGHPAVVLPNGFTADGSPTSITFTGDLYREVEVLVVASAYQRATSFHLERPDLEVAAKRKQELESEVATGQN